MVVVGTWNVENLFRPGSDAGPDSDAAYDAKLTALARTITGLAPDVLAVQEIGDPKALADLVTRLDGRWHSELADPDGRGIRVGVLSRLPLSDVEQVVAFPKGLRPIQVDDTDTILHQMGRPALRVRVTVNSTTVDVVSCHLKSKLLTFPGGRFSPTDEDERARFAVYALHRRAAEAATVRAYATALLAGHGQQRALLVTGDLNDEPRPRPRNSCTARPAPRSAHPGTTGRTRAMGSGCGTWPRSSRTTSASPVSTTAAANSSTTCSSLTHWSTPSKQSRPAKSTYPPSPTNPPRVATNPDPTTDQSWHESPWSDGSSQPGRLVCAGPRTRHARP